MHSRPEGLADPANALATWGAAEAGECERQDITSHGPYRGLPVLLLGASGFIGKSVAKALDRAGAEPTLVVRNAGSAQRTLAPLKVRGSVVVCDLSRRTNLADILERVRPAVVFNLVGYGVDPTERDEAIAQALNADLVSHLAEAMTGIASPNWKAQRVVHVGSALEYGAAGGNLPEETLGLPTTAYGRTKLAGTLALEAAGRTRGLRAVTARLFTVYGPGEHPQRLLPTLLAARGSRASIALTEGRQQRDFTFVEDVADGLLRLGLAPAPPGAIVNLATGRLTSVRAFVETAAGVLGLPSERLMFGAIRTRPEEMQHDAVALTRLKHLTGWYPAVDIVDGIRRAQQAADRVFPTPDATHSTQR